MRRDQCCGDRAGPSHRRCVYPRPPNRGRARRRCSRPPSSSERSTVPSRPPCERFASASRRRRASAQTSPRRAATHRRARRPASSAPQRARGHPATSGRSARPRCRLRPPRHCRESRSARGRPAPAPPPARSGRCSHPSRRRSAPCSPAPDRPGQSPPSGRSLRHRARGLHSPTPLCRCRRRAPSLTAGPPPPQPPPTGSGRCSRPHCPRRRSAESRRHPRRSHRGRQGGTGARSGPGPAQRPWAQA